jgi:hypothetical protein
MTVDRDAVRDEAGEHEPEAALSDATADPEVIGAVTLEEIVVGQGFADLSASPLQLAICRVVDGRPLDGVIDEATCERHFGAPELPCRRPQLVVLVCGVRGGKSFLVSCAAAHAALSADLSPLKHHELPRFVIVGPTVDAASATFKLLRGIVQSSPALQRLLVGEPTADTLVLERLDGRRVEIVVVAAQRGGLSVRNRWLVGFALEEVAQFGASETGAVVNAEEILHAAETRLLPGCQGWLISSPYGPQGLLHSLWKRHFGRPGRVLVVHAPTRALNPSFPQEQVEAIRAESPDVAAREYDATWLDADAAYYVAAMVDPATRVAPLQRRGRAVAAGMDPGTRGNSWTLAVAWPERDPLNSKRERIIVGAVWSWTGSRAAPLSPRATLQEIARVLRAYGVTRIHVDSWSFDAMQDHARAADLTLVEQPAGERDLPYQQLHTLLANGDVELPPDPTLRMDLLSVRQRATTSGMKIHLPRTVNGRHCDHVPSVALAVTYAASSNAVKYEEILAGMKAMGVC